MGTDLLQQALFTSDDVIETLVLKPETLPALLEVLRLARQARDGALAQAQLLLRVLERGARVRDARL
jgi:hypothetical protein